MHTEEIISGLERNKIVFQAILENRGKGEYCFKPSPDQWCMLEVVCHLVDEEKEDFRTRVDLVLANPAQQLPKFNPLAWVTDRDYMAQDFNKKRDEFLSEREASLDWLRSLQNPKWANAFDHPKLGKLSARLFLTNWLAHDYIHIRQINRLSYQYLSSKTEDRLDYAGNFKP